MNNFKTVYKGQLEMASIRLVKDAPIMSENEIHNPGDAVKLLGEYLCELDREVLCVINVKANGIPINCSICSMGAVDQTIAHPRELLKTAILSNAAGMIIMHNHPSGTLKPSKYDTMLTDQMAKVCQIMGISLLDHIIVGGDNSEYFSFANKKLLPMKEVSFETDYRELDLNKSAVAENTEMLVRPKHHR